MKTFFGKYGFNIFLSGILGIMIALGIGAYQEVQALKEIRIQVEHVSQVLTELEAEANLLVLVEDLKPAVSPAVGVGIAIGIKVVTEDSLTTPEGEPVKGILTNIGQVMCSGPAHKAGLIAGDEIISFNGHDMRLPFTRDGHKKLEEALSSVASSEAGTEVLIVVRRSYPEDSAKYTFRMSMFTAELPPIEEWKIDCASNSVK